MNDDWHEEAAKLWEAINDLTIEIKGITTEMTYIRKGLTWVIFLMASSMGIDVSGVIE